MQAAAMLGLAGLTSLYTPASASLGDPTLDAAAVDAAADVMSTLDAAAVDAAADVMSTLMWNDSTSGAAQALPALLPTLGGSAPLAVAQSGSSSGSIAFILRRAPLRAGLLVLAQEADGEAVSPI